MLRSCWHQRTVFLPHLLSVLTIAIRIVGDVILRIVVETAPPSWIRVHGSPPRLRSCPSRSYVPRTHWHHSKIGCPLSFRNYHIITPSVLSYPFSHLRHRESQRPHRHSPLTSSSSPDLRTQRKSPRYCGIPFITRTFPMYAQPCPGRCKPHTFSPQYILSTPVSVEEKKGSLRGHIAGLFLSAHLFCFISRTDVSLDGRRNVLRKRTDSVPHYIKADGREWLVHSFLSLTCFQSRTER